MDFQNIDGYEFEELIVKLLRTMSFDVEQTSLSGDGGIDIIAYNKVPILKGKYLIQCKNWRNTVGQPEVRDLYGVVMSEQANKGILITTSHFTKQAISFADNKNIELIGQDILIKLLKENNLFTENKNISISSSSGQHFSELSNFDKDKYLYLKSKVRDNRSEKIYYDNLRVFFHQHLISNNHDVNLSGLLDEYISFNDEIIKRFCKKSKEKVAEGKALRYINAFLYILNGDFFKAIENYKDIGLFKRIKEEGLYISSMLPVEYTCRHVSRNIDDFLSKYKLKLVEKHEECLSTDLLCTSDSTSPYIMITNLYYLFHKFEYLDGINYLERMYANYLKSVITLINKCDGDFRMPLYSDMYKYIHRDIIEVIASIRKDTHNTFYCPIDILTDKVGKEWDFKIQYNKDYFYSTADLFNIYYANKQDKIKSEIGKLRVILDIEDL